MKKDVGNMLFIQMQGIFFIQFQLLHCYKKCGKIYRQMFRFLEYPQALRQHLNNVIQCRRLRKGANMKHTTKLLALLLALIMVLGATMLTSCDSGDQPGADTTTPTIGDQTTTPAADTTPAETTPAPTVSKDLVVVKDGASTARVIRSENAAAASSPG